MPLCHNMDLKIFENVIHVYSHYFYPLLFLLYPHTPSHIHDLVFNYYSYTHICMYVRYTYIHMHTNY